MTSTNTTVYKLIELVPNLFIYLHNVYIYGALTNFFFRNVMLMKARKDTFLNTATDPLLPPQPQKRMKNSQNRDRRKGISEYIWTWALQNLYNAFFGGLSLSQIRRQIRKSEKVKKKHCYDLI